MFPCFTDVASGAKFNSKKTEIIPIGTQNFRELVIQQRRTSEDLLTLNKSIKILQEREVAHIHTGRMDWKQYK